MELPDWVREIPTWGYVAGAWMFWWMYVQQSAQKRWEKWAERIGGDLNAIVEWLKEIDPRMVEEQQLLDRAWDSVEREVRLPLAPMFHMELEREKEERGERTLADPLRRKARRKMEKEWDAKKRKASVL